MEVSQEYLDNAVATTYSMLKARAAGLALRHNGVFLYAPCSEQRLKPSARRSVSAWPKVVRCSRRTLTQMLARYIPKKETEPSKPQPPLDLLSASEPS